MIRTSFINEDNYKEIATAKITVRTSCINLSKMFKKAKKDLLNHMECNLHESLLYQDRNNKVFSDKYMLRYILSFVHNSSKYKFLQISDTLNISDEIILPVFKNLEIKSDGKFYLEDENIFLGKKWNTVESMILTKGYLIFEKKTDVEIKFDLISIPKKMFSPFIKLGNILLNFLCPNSGIYYSHSYKEFSVIGVSNYQYNLKACFIKLVMLFYHYGKHEGNISLCRLDALDWIRQHINVINDYRLCDYDKFTLLDQVNRIETVSEDSFTKDMLESFKKIVVTFN